jgi:hypothetical protein
MQVLMAEAAPVRELLGEQLARIEGKAATAALAQLALFDLSPRVRERAIDGLATRPAKDYRLALLRGFEHPWPAVADHAAEALVALKRKEMATALVRLLERPDPRAPYRKAGGKGSFVKELVRVNHHLNCLLCHAPSFDAADPVRGEVPSARKLQAERRLQKIGFGFGMYRTTPSVLLPSGPFVRADVTFLKQDFSATLAVDNPGLLPDKQRFDFLVRERLATTRDVTESAARAKAGPSEQHRAMLWAVRELKGRQGPGLGRPAHLASGR